jgi:hypothetical protein
MNDFNKYVGLLLLTLGGLLGFILVVAVIFFALKLAAITLFNIPGFETFYKFIITIIPYVIFFAAYYYLRNKLIVCKNKTSRTLAGLFLILGILVCLISLISAILKSYDVRSDWLDFFDDNSHYFLILQLLIVFVTAAVLGFGDPKEKDWMEKNKELQP